MTIQFAPPTWIWFVVVALMSEKAGYLMGGRKDD